MGIGGGEVTYDKPGEVGASDQMPINLPTFLHLLIEDSIPFGSARQPKAVLSRQLTGELDEELAGKPPKNQLDSRRFSPKSC